MFPTPEAPKPVLEGQKQEPVEEAPKDEWAKAREATDPEMAEAEARHKPEWQEKAQKGLEKMYEDLPHDKFLMWKDEFVEHMDKVKEFDEMLPGMKKSIAGDMQGLQLHKKSQAEFMKHGLHLLAMWVQLEAMKASGDEVLAKRARMRKAGM